MLTSIPAAKSRSSSECRIPGDRVSPQNTCFPTESFGAAHPPGPGKLAVDSAASGGALYAAGSELGQVLAYSNEVVPGVVTGSHRKV